MDEPGPTPLFLKLNRTLVLGFFGIITVGTGTLAGLWLNAETPDNSEGIHASAKEPPGVGADSNGGNPEHSDSESSLSDNELDFVASAGKWDEKASHTDRIANYMNNGDNALGLGDYAGAISEYRDVLRIANGMAEAAARFRLALSSECSGAIDDALDQYQAIAQKFSQTTWNDVAQLGRVRCLALKQDSAALSSIVYRGLVVDNTTLTRPVQREILHTAARGLCRALLHHERSALLAPDVLILAPFATDPNRELALLPELLAAEDKQTTVAAFDLLQRIDDDPDNIYFRLHTKHSSMSALVTTLARRAGLQLQMSEAARKLIASRRQAVHVDDMSLSLLLDGLCVPFGLVWKSKDDTINIAVADEVPDAFNRTFQLERVERLLSVARIDAPKSTMAAHTRVAHGCLLFETGRVADAVHLFEGHLSSGQAHELDVEAGFNLGKCYQQLGQLAQAEDAWYRCVDSSNRNLATLGAAYICLGRLQLEDARFQTAATSLVRGVDLTDGTELEQQAVALLGSAYLLDGNAAAANSAMFEHKDCISSPTVEKTIAFAAALARYRATGLSARRELEAQDLVTTLSHLDADRAFGSHWQVLAAQACDELGLADAALQHYYYAVQTLQDAGLKMAAMVRLAGRFRDEQRMDDAAQLLRAAREAESDSESQLAFEVKFQEADILLRTGQTAETVRLCRSIAVGTENDQLRRKALRLMGRAYERQKDHESAVYCFAGMLPQADGISAVVPASHREQH